MNKTFWIGAIVVIIILVIGYFAFFSSNGAMNGENGTTTAEYTIGTSSNQNGSTGGGAAAEAQNSVLLAENSAGNFVTVADARLSTPGFVAIYQVRDNGATQLIGHSDYLTSGEHVNLDIQTDSVLVYDEAVVAILYEDTDGDHKFGPTDGDTYLMNGSTLASDVDVVDVPADQEPHELNNQLDEYMRHNEEASSSTSS
jgi:hypothetical protein